MEYKKSWPGLDSFLVQSQFQNCCLHVEEELGDALHRLKQTRDAYESKLIEGKSDAESQATLKLLKHHYLQALNARKEFESNNLVIDYDGNDNAIYSTDYASVAEMEQAYQYYLNYLASIKEWIENVIVTANIDEAKFKKRLSSWACEADLIRAGDDPKLFDLDKE